MVRGSTKPSSSSSSTPTSLISPTRLEALEDDVEADVEVTETGCVTEARPMAWGWAGASMSLMRPTAF
jgi:hypothetical protein